MIKVCLHTARLSTRRKSPLRTTMLTLLDLFPNGYPVALVRQEERRGCCKEETQGHCRSAPNPKRFGIFTQVTAVRGRHREFSHLRLVADYQCQT